jgi:hypothetical protein
VNLIEGDVVLGADRAPCERDKLRFRDPREVRRPCILPGSSLQGYTSQITLGLKILTIDGVSFICHMLALKE